MVVTRKMVTWKEWCVRRRLASSTMGIMCPMPGLARRTACAFDVTISLLLSINQDHLFSVSPLTSNNIKYCFWKYVCRMLV